MIIDRVPSTFRGTRAFYLYAAILPTVHIAMYVVLDVAFASRFQSIYYKTIGGAQRPGNVPNGTLVAVVPQAVHFLTSKLDNINVTQ